MEIYFRLGGISFLLFVFSHVFVYFIPDITEKSQFNEPKSAFSALATSALPKDYSKTFVVVTDRTPSTEWDPSNTEQWPFIRDLQITMKLICKHHKFHGLIAANLKVNRRLLYSDISETHVMNPRHVQKEGETNTKWCKMILPNGTSTRRYDRYDPFTVRSEDSEDFTMKREYTFKGKESCVVQELIDQLNGKV